MEVKSGRGGGKRRRIERGREEIEGRKKKKIPRIASCMIFAEALRKHLDWSFTKLQLSASSSPRFLAKERSSSKLAGDNLLLIVYNERKRCSGHRYKLNELAKLDST
jgi:hypothetical protein